MRPLVIGIGNRWRRDDGVGPRVIDALAHRLPATVDLAVLDGEPARLVAAWQGRPWVLVVDAIRTGARPGTISIVEADRLEGALSSFPSSHAAGLDAAVGLARALDRLPDELLVIGIEPAELGHGDGLSEPVADAVEPLVRQIGSLAAETLCPTGTGVQSTRDLSEAESTTKS